MYVRALRSSTVRSTVEQLSRGMLAVDARAGLVTISRVFLKRAKLSLGADPGYHIGSGNVKDSG